MLSLLYLALFASVFGFGCYLTLLGRIGADRAAYASVAFPVVALGLSTMFEGFQWTRLAVAGVALIVIGNVVVLKRFGGVRAAVNRERLFPDDETAAFPRRCAAGIGADYKAKAAWDCSRLQSKGRLGLLPRGL